MIIEKIKTMVKIELEKLGFYINENKELGANDFVTKLKDLPERIRDFLKK
jgi:hypothetical protein